MLIQFYQSIDVPKLLLRILELLNQVVEAAKRRPDMLVQVGLEYRYMPPVAKLIDIVKGGTLGQVKMVAIREHRFPFLVKVFKPHSLPLLHPSNC